MNIVFMLAMAKAAGPEISILILASFIFLFYRWKNLDDRKRGLLLYNTALLLFWTFETGFIASRVVMFIVPGLFLQLAAALAEYRNIEQGEHEKIKSS